jgi:hypothetical protein
MPRNRVPLRRCAVAPRLALPRTALRLIPHALPTPGVWCLADGVCGVWCLVSGVWCLVSVLRHPGHACRQVLCLDRLSASSAGYDAGMQAAMRFLQVMV